MKERIISICLLLLAALTICLIVFKLPDKNYATPSREFTATPDVSGEVIRLHILADNDSERDQTIKLALRDILLPYLNSATLGATTKEEALAQLTAQCSSLTEIANAFLTEQHAGYTATVTVTNLYFPIRIYGSQTYLSSDAVIFPPGFYDSVQVVLGSGNGHNWWCLAYPSLCFIDASYDYIPKDSHGYRINIGSPGREQLKHLFYEETVTLGDETPTIFFGSKLWELMKALKQRITD